MHRPHIRLRIAQILPDKIASVVEGSSVRIVDYAVVPSRKVSPNVTLYTLVGLLAGFGVSVMMIAVRETMDDRIFSEDYLLEHFRDIPLLAVVPDSVTAIAEDAFEGCEQLMLACQSAESAAALWAAEHDVPVVILP